MKRHVNCGALSFISLISNSIEQVANEIRFLLCCIAIFFIDNNVSSCKAFCDLSESANYNERENEHC